MKNEIYFLSEYNWELGDIISEGPKNYRIKYRLYDVIVRVDKKKCARPDERVCIVWEQWKGRNGRGAYRVERQMYEAERRPASEVSRQPHQSSGRVNELRNPFEQPLK